LAYALQQLINGVTLGMIYGLIAVGLALIFGLMDVLNLSEVHVSRFDTYVRRSGLEVVRSVPKGSGNIHIASRHL